MTNLKKLTCYFPFMRKHFFLICTCLSILSGSVQGQWRLINPLPTNNNLNNMVFLDNDRGVAIGARGTVLKTRDGGENWDLIAPFTCMDLNALAYMGDDKLLLCGDQGLILTTDFSFSRADTFHAGDAYNLNTIHFLNAKKGFCAGTSGIFLTTEDAGNSWSSVIINADFTFTELEFPDDSTGYLAGINTNNLTNLSGVLLKSSDAGRLVPD